MPHEGQKFEFSKQNTSEIFRRREMTRRWGTRVSWRRGELKHDIKDDRLLTNTIEIAAHHSALLRWSHFGKEFSQSILTQPLTPLKSSFMWARASRSTVVNRFHTYHMHREREGKRRRRHQEPLPLPPSYSSFLSISLYFRLSLVLERKDRAREKAGREKDLTANGGAKRR